MTVEDVVPRSAPLQHDYSTRGRMNEFAEVIQSVLARATLLLCAGDRELRR